MDTMQSVVDAYLEQFGRFRKEPMDPAPPAAIEAAAEAWQTAVGEPMPTDAHAFFEQVDGVWWQGQQLYGAEELARVTTSLHERTGERTVFLGSNNDVSVYLYRPGQGFFEADYHDWTHVDVTYATFPELASAVVTEIVEVQAEFG